MNANLIRSYRGEYAKHTHAHAQLLVGLDGILDIEVEGRGVFVDSSCGLVIPAQSAHAYRAARPASVLVFDCEPQAGTDRLRWFAVPQTWRRAALQPLHAGTVLALAQGARLLHARRRLDLSGLKAIVDAELHRDWTVAELAARCGLSPQRLRARLVDAVGVPPLTWLRQRRLNEAERLLRRGVPVETVAIRVGYATASALTYALRRDRGVGARALRTRHR